MVCVCRHVVSLYDATLPGTIETLWHTIVPTQSVKAELPGMKREDIEVSLHEGSLSISGERKSEQKHEDAGVYRAERFFGRFQRTVMLPTPVAAEKVKAQYKDGILTITLPKTEEAKPKHIDINVS